jgi:hypothetical protein
MKKILTFALLLFVLPLTVHPQFKDSNIFKPSVKDGMINDSPNFILGIFDASKFTMHHTYSMSYSSMGKEGIALGVYTNSMQYNFTDKLNVQFDASLVHSPYSTLGKNFQNSISGIYIDRAQLNYAPWDNVTVMLQYRQIPYSSYYGGNDYFNSSPFSMFNGQ